jgi:2-haloacid dehalogenase
LFEEAVAAGTPVYLLSNIAAFHINAIERNWPDFFQGVSGMFLSYRIGVRKPHPYIYRYALDALGAEGGQCFFIDDLPDNVETARSFGIDAHLYLPGNHASIREAAASFFGW